MGGVRHGSKERHPHGPYDVAVKTLADAAVASSKYPYAKPRDFVVNVLVFAVLLQYCVPLSKLWPHDGNWDDYPIPAGVYAFFRGLRLVLRCATFTCCIARFIFKCSVSEKTSTTAVDQLVHTILGTIWPTERRAMVAMGLFFFIAFCKAVPLANRGLRKQFCSIWSMRAYQAHPWNVESLQLDDWLVFGLPVLHES